MSVLNAGSLVQTVDNLNEAFVSGVKIPKSQRVEAGNWIAARIGQAGSYRGLLPAPTADDFALGGKTYTGEAIHSRAGLACKIGAEAARALLLLHAPGKAAARARDESIDAALTLLARSEEWEQRSTGMYCCCSCSVAFWRLLAATEGSRPRRFLSCGLRTLRSRRDGTGRWQGFPFWYTTLSLGEIDDRAARAELQYVAPLLERSLRRRSGDDVFARRKVALAQSVLARV